MEMEEAIRRSMESPRQTDERLFGPWIQNGTRSKPDRLSRNDSSDSTVQTRPRLSVRNPFRVTDPLESSGVRSNSSAAESGNNQVTESSDDIRRGSQARGKLGRVLNLHKTLYCIVPN